MAQALEAASSITSETNLQSAIESRAAAGKIPCVGPFLVMLARPVLMVVGQGLVALILAAFHQLNRGTRQAIGGRCTAPLSMSDVWG